MSMMTSHIFKFYDSSKHILASYRGKYQQLPVRCQPVRCQSWCHQNLEILRIEHLSSNKKIHSLYIKGYNMAKNSFLAEATFSG